MRIALASASPRRQELLRQIGLRFDILPGEVDESVPEGMTPMEVCRALAVRKARAAARRWRLGDGEGLVLAADTIVVLGEEVLGKPADPPEAEAMLSRLAGRTHRVFTGVAVGRLSGRGEGLDGPGGFDELDVAHEETKVWMRALTPAQIAAYVRSGEPLDKAGAYGVQGLGAVLVERLEGCYYNVVGLPLSRVCRMLERHGVVVLG